MLVTSKFQELSKEIIFCKKMSVCLFPSEIELSTSKPQMKIFKKIKKFQNCSIFHWAFLLCSRRQKAFFFLFLDSLKSGNVFTYLHGVARTSEYDYIAALNKENQAKKFFFEFCIFAQKMILKKQPFF